MLQVRDIVRAAWRLLSSAAWRNGWCRAPCAGGNSPAPCFCSLGSSSLGSLRSGGAQKAQQPAVCPHSCCCTLSCVSVTTVSTLREIIPLLSTCGAVSGYWQGRITVNVSPTQEQVARRGYRIMSFRILTDPLDVTPDILL